MADHRPDAQRQQNGHGYQTAIADQVRRRGLRWFARSGLLIAEDTRDMLAWDNTGFSLDAAVSIASHDRAAVERLLRFFALPPIASEWLRHIPVASREG